MHSLDPKARQCKRPLVDKRSRLWELIEMGLFYAQRPHRVKGFEKLKASSASSFVVESANIPYIGLFGSLD